MAKKSKPRRLSFKQNRFVREYVKNGGNGAKAVRDAGYKYQKDNEGVTAHQNLKKPHIEEAVQQETKILLEASQLTPEHVLKGLMKYSGLDGTELADNASPGATVRAMELCGKTFAMFSDRVITEEETLSPLELILKLIADDCPNMAIAAAIDLCSLDFETVNAVREIAPEIADKIEALIPNSNPDIALFKQSDSANETPES